MKDKAFIYYSDPCVTPLDDPKAQTLEDIESRALAPCPYYPARRECSAPDFACVRIAGAAMARFVLQFYSEATEETLAQEKGVSSLTPLELLDIYWRSSHVTPGEQVSLQKLAQEIMEEPEDAA